MSRTLVIATIAGLGLCGASLGAAVLVGGDDIFHDPRSLGGVKPLIDLATHKAWRWNGGDTLALDAPINIRYQPKASAQGDAPQVALIGPADVLEHVKVGDGRITADASVTRAGGRRVEAVVSGAPIRKFVINNQENLDLGEINQKDLDLHLNGNGTVFGRGKVDRLNLTIAGQGNAKLGGLEVMGDSKISILGSGDATLSPHGKVRLFVAGSGDLRLLTKPTELHRTIIGSGEVMQLEGEAAKKALEAVDASRIASDTAREAIRSSLGDGWVGEIASEAVRKGIEDAQIDRHVRDGLDRGMARLDRQMERQMDRGIDRTEDSVTVRNHRGIDLGHIDQQRLKVTVLASGSVDAEGKVDLLQVQVMGSGEVNLGKLAARRVEVTIAGSGDVTVAPGDELKVNIMGSGDVHLTTKPARVEQKILGSGHIIEPR
jgi:hypothetical protein